MSFTYGSVLFFLLLPTAAAFLLGLVFWRRLRSISYVCRFIGVAFLALTVATIIKHALHNKEESKGMLGLYKLDPTQSKYHKDVLTKFADLTLTVTDNYTFVFNKPTPIFPGTCGKWNFEDDGDVAITECSFNNTNETFQIPDGFGQWTFPSYSLSMDRTAT